MQTELNNPASPEIKSPSLPGILYNPVEHIKRFKFKSPVLLPLIIVVIISMIYTGLISYMSITDQSLYEASEQLNTSVQRLKLTASVFAGAASLISLFFSLFITAILLKIFLAFTNKSLNFKTLFSLNIHINMVTILSLTINLLINALTWNGQYHVYTNFSEFFTKGTIWSIVFLTLDPFALWTYILLGLGLHYLAGSNKKQIIALITIIIIFTAITNMLSQVKI